MGTEFVELFEKWAENYDKSVMGNDLEYQKVFYNYDEILKEVADRAFGHVLEFGTGTGNLTLKLLEKGLKVTGIEPSDAMKKIGEKKIGANANIFKGDFLHYPADLALDSIVSTYAFHHLTDQEKGEAILSYSNILAPGGKIIFADTMYKSLEDFKQAISDAVQSGFHNLAEDLQREYYPTIPVLKKMMEENSFTVTFSKCNDFVWIMEGVKI
ncbi:class I SAM-dependent methyltransferase [Bacillus sp. 03113]|uniref:class I SAM-dependent methyltransferase n=1 Tax=Bacillus sp. 03113 TaxID=2578211 RepID=UPI00114364D6|nr:class I SAM-dependent methyltransferase [Bacillus sp. 03113]